MKPFTFVPYDPSQAEEVLPRMFDILSGNMSAIAPTGRSNEEDRETWLAYMASEQGAARRVLRPMLRATDSRHNGRLRAVPKPSLRAPHKA